MYKRQFSSHTSEQLPCTVTCPCFYLLFLLFCTTATMACAKVSSPVSQAGCSPHEPCPVCLEDISITSPPLGGMFSYFEDCPHYFHFKCTASWLLERRRSCPVCRTKFQRVLLWPSYIRTEDERRAVMETQKRCVGLFGLTSGAYFYAELLQDVISINIAGSVFDLNNISEMNQESEEPDSEDNSDVELENLQFHLESCPHSFPTKHLSPYLREMKRNGTVTCSICDTTSGHLLLWPASKGFQSQEEKDKIFYVQKLCFRKMTDNHRLVIAKQHNQGDWYSILADGKRYLVHT